MTPRADHLKALLERHRPSDDQEAGYLRRMLTLCSGPGDAFARDHFVPGHFTASAFILSPTGDALLLILHSKLKRWLQPGGHVDPQDGSILAAAEREVREEVGLSGLSLLHDGLFDLDIHDIPPLKNDPAHAHFDVRFAFRAKDLSFKADSDAESARWLPLSEVNESISDRSVMRAVEKLAR